MAEDLLTVPSLARTIPQELAELRKKTARERVWYEGRTVYRTNQDILAAAYEGKLSIVNQNRDFVPIWRLRNPELFHRFPPYLLPHSLVALRAVGQLWRLQLAVEGVEAPRTLLSVTSLARSHEIQQELVRRGKLADPESTHRVGAAFDIDASGYYVNDPVAGLEPVVHPDRDREGMRRATEILQAQVTAKYEPSGADFEYDPRISSALLSVADRLHSLGLVNRIVEFTEDPANLCVHFAPHPDAVFPL